MNPPKRFELNEDVEELNLMLGLSMNNALKIIEIAQTENEIENYIKGWSSLSTEQKREATDILFKKYIFDESQKEIIHKIKKITDPEKRKEDFYNWIISQKIKIDVSKPDDNDTPPYNFPDNPIISMAESEMQEVREEDLPNYTDDYNDVISSINNISKSSNIYNNIFQPKIFPSSIKDKGSDGQIIPFYKAFSVPQPKLDLTVTIDGEEYTGGGGLDFEAKIEANEDLIKTLIENQLGHEIKIISNIPDPSNFALADFKLVVKKVIKGKVVGEDIGIDLELKKYSDEKKYKDYNTTEKINNGISKMFNEWFLNYKKDLMNVYDKCETNNNFDEYNKKLDAITTNKKIDNEKLLDMHIKSGHYFSLPLTITKSKTPSKDVIMDVMSKKYPNNLEDSVQLANYMHHHTRINKSNNILMTLFLVQDALIVDNISKTFKDKVLLDYCSIGYNAYGKKRNKNYKIKDAYNMPALFMQSFDVSQNLFNKSKNYSIDEMKQTRINEITKKKQAKGN
jgi:hypothetical protein